MLVESMNQSYKKVLEELRMINLEKKKFLERRQDCYLWLFKGLTCSRRRAECRHCGRFLIGRCLFVIYQQRNNVILKPKTEEKKVLFPF